MANPFENLPSAQEFDPNTLFAPSTAQFKSDPYAGMTHEKNETQIAREIEDRNIKQSDAMVGGALGLGKEAMRWLPVIGEAIDLQELKQDVDAEGWTPMNKFMLGSIALPYAPAKQAMRQAKKLKPIWDMLRKNVRTEIHGVGDVIRTEKSWDVNDSSMYNILPESIPMATRDEMGRYFSRMDEVMNSVPVHRELGYPSRGTRDYAVAFTKDPELSRYVPAGQDPEKFWGNQIDMLGYVRRTADRDAAGKFIIDPAKFKDSSVLGGISVTNKGKHLAVSVTHPLPGPLRGEGVGLELYGKVMADAIEGKKKFASDEIVSAQAQNVWKSLDARGVKVELHPQASLGKDGTLYAPNGESVFVTNTDDATRFMRPDSEPTLKQRLAWTEVAADRRPRSTTTPLGSGSDEELFWIGNEIPLHSRAGFEPTDNILRDSISDNAEATRLMATWHVASPSDVRAAETAVMARRSRPDAQTSDELIKRLDDLLATSRARRSNTAKKR